MPAPSPSTGRGFLRRDRGREPRSWHMSAERTHNRIGAGEILQTLTTHVAENVFRLKVSITGHELFDDIGISRGDDGRQHRSVRGLEIQERSNICGTSDGFRLGLDEPGHASDPFENTPELPLREPRYLGQRLRGQCKRLFPEPELW